jgi:hypothetical protein
MLSPVYFRDTNCYVCLLATQTDAVSSDFKPTQIVGVAERIVLEFS